MRNVNPGLYLVFVTLCLLLFGSNGCSQGESKQARNIAGERDDLLGWYRMADNTLIPVFKYNGTYYSVSRGFEFPLQPCPEGLVMGMEPSSTNGTTIGRLGQSNRYFISIYDEPRAQIEEGFISGQKQEMVKVKKPSGLLDKKTKAPAPRTNDDFLGWYMPVWFPYIKIEIRKDGSDYFSTDHEMRHSGQGVAGKPVKLTLRTEGLGFIPFRVVNSREQSRNLRPHSYLAATEREFSTGISILSAVNR